VVLYGCSGGGSDAAVFFAMPNSILPVNWRLVGLWRKDWGCRIDGLLRCWFQLFCQGARRNGANFGAIGGCQGATASECR
jgi:hypothetical protein